MGLGAGGDALGGNSDRRSRSTMVQGTYSTHSDKDERGLDVREQSVCWVDGNQDDKPKCTYRELKLLISVHLAFGGWQLHKQIFVPKAN